MKEHPPAPPPAPEPETKPITALVPLERESPADTRGLLERKLIHRVQTGDQSALNALISQNLGYITKVAKNYSRFNVPLAELVNEGVVGFSYAVQRFDLRQPVRLITYATYWIKHYILEFLSFHSNLISIPLKKARQAKKINRTIQELKNRLGRPPKIAEVAEVLKMGVEEIRKLLPASLPLLSLDKFVGPEEGSTLGELVPDVSRSEPSEAAVNNLLRQRLAVLVNDFRDREKKILGMYFGLEGAEERSLRDIGEIFSLSQEGVRKIINKALLRLKERGLGN